MRLIDADALRSECRGIIQNYETRGDDYGIGKCGGMTQAMNEIDSAPTVDAIPVEWLRDKMRGYTSSLKSTETAALVMVMQMWQQEQEAR